MILFSTPRSAHTSPPPFDGDQGFLARAERFSLRWMKWSVTFTATVSLTAIVVSTHVSPLSTHRLQQPLNSGAITSYAALPASRNLPDLLFVADPGKRGAVVAGSLLEAGLSTLSIPILRRQVALDAGNTTLHVALGEALVLANRGIVVPEAKEAFDRVLASDPNDLIARFYMAYWLLQNGKAKPALVKLVGLMKTAGADTFWNDKLWEALPIAGDQLGLTRLTLLALCAPGM